MKSSKLTENSSFFLTPINLLCHEKVFLNPRHHHVNMGGIIAQCEEFPFNINLEGFNCGTTGTICIEVDFNFIDVDNCALFGNFHHAELIFPTGSFNVTNFDDFTLLSSDPTGNTILSSGFPVFLDALVIRCLEGELLTPGTVFTFNIVEDADPDNIINSQTFELEGTTVGSPGVTTTLTQAIALGDLLDVADAAETGQSVLIEGTLVIDQDYDFSTFTLNSLNGLVNNITMGEDARIEVDPNFTLGVRRGQIHGCDERWDRILLKGGSRLELRSLEISDADVAVELTDDSDLFLNRSNFFFNGIGIGSFGSNMKDINIETVGSFLNFPRFMFGDEGIHLENTELIDFGPFILISNMDGDGIYLKNADVNLDFVNIFECRSAVREDEGNGFLATDLCSFTDNLETGIFTRGTNNFLINDSFFWVNDNGIIRHMFSPQEFTRIELSSFSNNRLIDVMAFPQASEALIESNSMGSFPQSVYNIFAADAATGGTHDWKIQNHTALDAGTANLFLRNIVGATVLRNRENIVGGRMNFEVHGGGKNNFIQNEAEASILSFSLFGSPQTTYECNEMQANTWNMNVFNNCGGSDFRGNEMTSVFENLTYGNALNTFAVSSPQPFKGNEFDFSSGQNHKAIHHEPNPDLAELSQYLVPMVTQGSPQFPFFTSSSIEWFKPENGTSFKCPPLLAEPDPVDHVLRLTESSTTGINLLDMEIDTIYGAEVEFDTELKLFRALNELDELTTLTPEFQTWHDALETTVVGEIIEFETLFGTAVSYSDTEAAQAKILTDTILSLRNQLNAIEWYTYNETTREFDINETEKQNREVIISDLKAQIAAHAVLIDARKTAMTNALPQLTVINNGLSDLSTQSAQNFQAVNGFLIQKYTPGFSGYTPTQITTITNIANQCVGQGGEAVYSARTLLAEQQDTVFEYNDECITPLSGSRNSTAQTEFKESDFSVYPNPAQTHALIQLPSVSKYQSLKITDVLGHSIREISIPEGVNQIPLSTSEFNSGIYFIVPDKNTQKAIRLIISK